MSKKLFLLDAMALIYRAYFAFKTNPRINSKGLNTSAMLGFTNTLYEVLKTQKPTHIGVAFDTQQPTHRHIEFEAYKAHREAMPDELVLSLPYIDRILEAFRIPKLFVHGFEADDVIGTLAKKAELQSFTTFMMTPDKDYAQLVSDNIFMYKPGKMGNPAEIWGVQEVLEKFEIKRPTQVIDILGLWGDASDNIPGIPSIGEKRAKELIAQYDSIENLIAHSHELKGKMAENVKEFAQQGLLSKHLATITLDVPIALDEEALVTQEPDFEILMPLFEELEFKTFAQRIKADYKSKMKAPNVETPKKDSIEEENAEEMDFEMEQEAMEVMLKKHEVELQNYKIIAGTESFEKAIAPFQNAARFAFFPIYHSPNDSPKLLGIALSCQANAGIYLPVAQEPQLYVNQLKAIQSLFNAPDRALSFDLKLFYKLLWQHQIEIQHLGSDLLLAHYLLEPDQKHDLELLIQNFLGLKIQSEQELLDNAEAQPSLFSKGGFEEIEVQNLCNFACQRSDLMLQMWPMLEQKLNKTNTFNLLHHVEMPLTRVLAQMESEGVRLESSVLTEFSKSLKLQIDQVEKLIYVHAGHIFNIASPKQLGVVLYEELKISEKPQMTKTKQYKTGEEVLVKYLKRHPIVSLILDHRGLSKLRNTYVDALPKLINPLTKRLHTTYNQAIAATGRLSSINPNLQNIPIRTADGREIRKAFVATDNQHLLLAADYSQIELRIIAHMSQDENMMRDFIARKDIHTATAARVYNVAETEVTKDMRRNAKSVNFGIIYGISAFGLSENLDISRSEAKEIIDNYFQQYAGIKRFMDLQIQSARENGFVETLLKRRRYLKNINSSNAVVRAFDERNAINAPIQGSSADMIKLAMIGIFKEMNEQKLKSKLILQVHDELIFDALIEEMEPLKKLVHEQMVQALTLSIPIEVDMNTGTNWLEAH